MVRQKTEKSVMLKNRRSSARAETPDEEPEGDDEMDFSDSYFSSSDFSEGDVPHRRYGRKYKAKVMAVMEPKFGRMVDDQAPGLERGRIERLFCIIYRKASDYRTLMEKSAFDRYRPGDGSFHERVLDTIIKSVFKKTLSEVAAIDYPERKQLARGMINMMCKYVFRKTRNLRVKEPKPEKEEEIPTSDEEYSRTTAVKLRKRTSEALAGDVERPLHVKAPSQASSDEEEAAEAQEKRGPTVRYVAVTSNPKSRPLTTTASRPSSTTASRPSSTTASRPSSTTTTSSPFPTTTSSPFPTSTSRSKSTTTSIPKHTSNTMDSNSSSPSFKRSLSPSEEKVNKKLARAVSMTKSPSPPAKRARKAATPQAAPQAGQDHKLVCLPKEAKHLKSSLQEQVATKSSEKLAKDLKRSLQEELATESSEKFAKECALLELQLKNLAKAGEVLDLKLEILKLLLEKAKSGDFTMAVVKEALN